MKRRGFIRAMAAVTATGLPGMADGLMAGDPPDAPQKRIDPNAATSPWTAVASLGIAGSVYSATLIHPRYVITAGHVAPADPSQVIVNLVLGGSRPVEHAVQRTIHHPRFMGFNPQAPAFDLALLELRLPAPPAARLYPIFQGSPEVGMELTLVGYGASGYGAAGVTVPAHTTIRRVGLTRLDRLIEPTGRSGHPLVYAFEFRQPLPDEPRVAGYPTGLASGDSGSACFVRSRNQFELFGVNTFVSRPPGSTGPMFGYGTLGGGQILAPQLQWILSEIESGQGSFQR